ncbi:hypothetical protein ACLB2K_004812 [Fragaria x ananassa]
MEEADSPTPRPPFVEVKCESSGMRRRFAIGTEAGFAASVINNKLGSVDSVYIEAVKEGEEPITFGPNSLLVDYGHGWTLHTVTGEGVGRPKPIQVHHVMVRATIILFMFSIVVNRAVTTELTILPPPLQHEKTWPEPRIPVTGRQILVIGISPTAEFRSPEFPRPPDSGHRNFPDRRIPVTGFSPTVGFRSPDFPLACNQLLIPNNQLLTS